MEGTTGGERVVKYLSEVRGKNVVREEGSGNWVVGFERRIKYHKINLKILKFLTRITFK